MLSFILFLSLAVLQPFTAQNFFRIVVSVRDDTGHAVQSIRISLEDENNQSKGTGFADSSGRYQFKGLTAGTYVVRIETFGTPYAPAAVAVDLTSLTSSINTSTTEDTTPVDIVLKRKRVAPGSAPAVVFVQTVPPPAREEFMRGIASLDKDPAVGIASLKKAIELFPEYFDALELLGTQYVKTGLTKPEGSREQFETATPILTKALAVNSKAAVSMYYLGVALLKLNHVSDAITMLQNATAQDGSNANAFLWLGLAHGNVGSLDQAELALKKAYEIGRSDVPEAHLYLAGLYNKRERYGEAWRELELYLKEAKGLKDKTQIKDMIGKLKVKEKEKPKP